MKKIMILGASILQLPAIKKAKEMGLEVIAVDMDPNAIGFKEDNIICEEISTIDTPSVLKAAKKHNIDGIMTLASDMPMQTVAVVAKELGLIGISEDTSKKATNKYLMRKALKENNVPIPKFFKISTLEEYLKVVNNFNEPFIVKPADNSGSRGIDLVDDIQNEKIVREAFEYSQRYSRSGDVLVEEYMTGPEVSVETISVNGNCHVIQITDKLTTGAPYFVEMGHSQPSQLAESIKEEIKIVAKDAVRAVGIKNGPSHTEIKVTKDGPKIVELGARLGGDNITTHLTPLSTGVDMVESCIRIAMGGKPDLQMKHNRGSAIRYFDEKIGKIVNIMGVCEAKKLIGVNKISILKGIGENLLPIKSSNDRIGFVIANGENVDEAIETCNKAIELMKVVIE